MFRPGGIMVYSTCSLNPIENEGVVSAMLNYAKGTLELVDTKDMYPGLKRADVILDWKVIDKKLNTYSSVEEVPEELKKRFVDTVFPAKNINSLNIDRWYYYDTVLT